MTADDYAEALMNLPKPHFRRVKWREGYDMAEVDAFIERLRATADGRPGVSRVTADEVRTVQFSSARFRREGYDVVQVDLFLEQVEGLLDPPR